MPVTVYRSTDPGAPVLMGLAGTLVDVLTACLVDGYGGTFASATITNDGVQPSDGDTVTIGAVTYTFRTSLTGQPAYAVLIGASAATTMGNLDFAIRDPISGAAALSVGTLPHPDVWSQRAGTVTTVTARRAGSAGNSIALAEGSTHLVVSGATLSGGGGVITKAGAGWTKPYTAPGKGVFRQGGGNQFFLDVNDLTATGPQEAWLRGYETMTAVGTGTGPFPTVAQLASGIFVRKASNQDSVNRPWVVIADDRTFYLFVQSGDSAGVWFGFGFGDFFSYLAGTDNFRSFIMGRALTGGTTTTENADKQGQINAAVAGHYIARSYTGIGGSVGFSKLGDSGKAGTSTLLSGAMTVPSPVDGKIWIAPVFIGDGTTVRGKLRGFMHFLHPVASFADQDTVAGAGPYAGHTFLLFKNTGNAAAYCMDVTGPWQAN